MKYIERGWLDGSHLAVLLAMLGLIGSGWVGYTSVRFCVVVPSAPGYQHQLAYLFEDLVSLPAFVGGGALDEIDGSRADPAGSKNG